MKKSFKSINYVQLGFDLVIVFIGVYLAFLFSNYQEGKKQQRDGQRVIAVLKVGLQRYSNTFTNIAGYHEQKNAEIRASLEGNEIPYFGGSYYPAPQYPLDVVNFILTRESFEVFDVDIYVHLTQFSNAIQRIMYIEEKIALTSEEFRYLPPEDDPTYDQMFRDQYVLATRYLDYMERRKNAAQELVQVINALSSRLNEEGS